MEKTLSYPSENTQNNHQEIVGTTQELSINNTPVKSKLISRHLVSSPSNQSKITPSSPIYNYDPEAENSTRTSNADTWPTFPKFLKNEHGDDYQLQTLAYMLSPGIDYVKMKQLDYAIAAFWRNEKALNSAHAKSEKYESPEVQHLMLIRKRLIASVIHDTLKLNSTDIENSKKHWKK